MLYIIASQTFSNGDPYTAKIIVNVPQCNDINVWNAVNIKLMYCGIVT